MTEGTADAGDAAAIERLSTQLVQMAPHCEPAVAGELVERLARIDDLGAPVTRPLARSIAHVVSLIAQQAGADAATPRIDLAGALPLLAMACATLADGMRGALGARELEAARYEIDSLLPVPAPPRPAIAEPDVPASALSRGPRRRT